MTYSLRNVFNLRQFLLRSYPIKISKNRINIEILNYLNTICQFRYQKYGTYSTLRTNCVGNNKINLLIKLAFINCAHFNNTLIRVNIYQHFFEYLFVIFFSLPNSLFEFSQTFSFESLRHELSCLITGPFARENCIDRCTVFVLLEMKTKTITFEISFNFTIRLHTTWPIWFSM